MSIRYEWATTSHSFFDIEMVMKGTLVGEFPVEEEVALVFSTDEVYVLESSVDELENQLTTILAQLRRLKRHREKEQGSE